MPYTFPAVKGKQKDTEFFLATMDYGEIARLVVLPESSEGKRLLNGEQDMQRRLNWARVKNEMKNYLVQNPDSFYSSLTLFLVPHNLQPLIEGEGYEFFPAETRGKKDASHGDLAVKSTVIFFPGDGQHRAASIKEALYEDPELATEPVPVVLIPFKSVSQVRQLFSDLNLNAKPVNRTIGLSFETRDPTAILSKRVAKDVPLFRGRVNMRSNSLAATSSDVITLNALYGGNKLLLEGMYGSSYEMEQAMASITRHTEDDPLVGEQAQPLDKVWNIVISSFDEWQRVQDVGKPPSEVRRDYIFAHALGWVSIAHAAMVIIKSHRDGWESELRQALMSVNWSRSNEDWQGVAMNGDRVNNTSSNIRATAGYILRQAGITNYYAGDYLKALAKAQANTRTTTAEEAIPTNQAELNLL